MTDAYATFLNASANAWCECDATEESVDRAAVAAVDRAAVRRVLDELGQWSSGRYIDQGRLLIKLMEMREAVSDDQPAD
jgi:hypothetical protein